MSKSLKQLQSEITEIELKMSEGDFWSDKTNADQVLKTYQELKKEETEYNKRLGGNALMTIYAGAGGDDAEDFTRMLSVMYENYGKKNGFDFKILDSQDTNSGYRSVSYEIVGKRAYGTFMDESGVHRLVRLSPFNSKHTRETSFALVDVVPIIENLKMVEIPDRDIEVAFSKSGGPGGQNVNKRETAVRALHLPTGISVHVATERSQELNRAKAVSMLYSKLAAHIEKLNLKSANDLALAGKIDNEWGNQIRNYVLHPYKMVKDLRTGAESSDPDAVLAGNLDILIVQGS